MEESAGCIIIKHFNGVPHILLAHATGNWRTKLMGFPKGHIDEGESLEKAAIRETKEEVGIVPDIINYIGFVKTKKGKKVHAYLAFVESGKLNGKKATELHKEEIDYAKFFPLKDAEQLVYDYQRPLIQKAKEHVELWDRTCEYFKLR